MAGVGTEPFPGGERALQYAAPLAFVIVAIGQQAFGDQTDIVGLVRGYALALPKIWLMIGRHLES